MSESQVTGTPAMEGAPSFGPSLARANLTIALELAKGLQPLAEAGPICASAMNFLAAQVVETGLKAYLALSLPEDELKKKFGHNIVACWTEARRLGLAIDTAPSTSIAALAKWHLRGDHPMRYGQEGVTLLVIAFDGEALRREVMDLLAVVKGAISTGG